MICSELSTLLKGVSLIYFCISDFVILPFFPVPFTFDKSILYSSANSWAFEVTLALSIGGTFSSTFASALIICSTLFFAPSIFSEVNSYN